MAFWDACNNLNLSMPYFGGNFMMPSFSSCMGFSSFGGMSGMFSGLNPFGFSAGFSGVSNPFSFQSSLSMPMLMNTPSYSLNIGFMPNSFGFGNMPMMNWGNFDMFSRSSGASASGASSGSYGSKMVSIAESFLGWSNKGDEKCNKKFSPSGYRTSKWWAQHGRWGWCSDFATYCAKQALGAKWPKSMGNYISSPGGWKKKASPLGAYLEVPSSNKNSWLAANVHPGDIIYMKGSGDSGQHIAVVKSVSANGKIEAISGNSGNMVKRRTYDINSSGIHGFVSLGKLAQAA